VSDCHGRKYIKVRTIRENAFMRSAIDRDMGSIFPMLTYTLSVARVRRL
jgi:hypothetical protein